MGERAIKICGVSTPDALDAAVAAGADHVGFVFYPPSPRAVTAAQAAQLANRAEGRIARVGLFVDASDAEVAEGVASARLDGIQLHGRESPGRAAELRARFALPVWKAIAVTSVEDVERARQWKGAADVILFDAKTPAGTLPGGMGLSFDWSLLSRVRLPPRWGLAGGLSPRNVAEAVRMTNAPLLDVSSGVETAAGVKDGDAIRAFVRAARAG